MLIMYWRFALILSLQIIWLNGCRFDGELIYKSKDTPGKTQILKPDPSLPRKTQYKDIHNEDMCMYSLKAAPKDKDGKCWISDNFHLGEFASFWKPSSVKHPSKSKCGTKKEVFDGIRISPLLVKCLQKVRRKTNSITIKGAYRAPKHNDCRGGASKSRHLSGTAADILLPKDWKKGIKDFLDIIICECKDLFSSRGYGIGMGLASGRVHIDHRNSKGTVESWLYHSGTKIFKADDPDLVKLPKKKRPSTFKSKDFNNWIKNDRCSGSSSVENDGNEGSDDSNDKPQESKNSLDWRTWWKKKKLSWFSAYDIDIDSDYYDDGYYDDGYYDENYNDIELEEENEIYKLLDLEKKRINHKYRK